MRFSQTGKINPRTLANKHYFKNLQGVNMVTRSILIAALCATASLAHAGPMSPGASLSNDTVVVSQMEKVNAMLRNDPDAGGDWRLSSQQASSRAGAAAKIYTSVSQGGAWRGPEAPYLALKAQGGPLAAGVPLGLGEVPVEVSSGSGRSADTHVPEPASIMLMLGGLMGAGFFARRRRS